MVPHLVTALNGPLMDLERRMLESTPQIERWFRLEWQEHTPPFYCSVDLRNAGFKLAPVDTNLFPSGFDNLSPDVMPLVVQAAMAAIEKYCPDARNLLLIPQQRGDARYLQHLARLQSVLRQTGLTVRVASLDPTMRAPLRLEAPGAPPVLVEPLERRGRRIGVGDFEPCAVLINNDLAHGIPPTLDDLYEQTVLPPTHAGWTVRRKSRHFAAYQEVAKRFAKMLDIDPWLLNPASASCGEVDFGTAAGVECVAAGVDAVLKQIRSKYREYGVDEQPFVIVKADTGSEGAGVVTVRSGAEVRGLDAERRERMRLARPGQPIHEVIIQEGVPTMETVDDGVAEPVVYMIDKYVVGGFYRVHPGLGRDDNLNAPGMHFVPLPFASSCNLPDANATPGAACNRFYAYGVVARLALIAAAIELERTDPDQSLYG